MSIPNIFSKFEGVRYLIIPKDGAWEPTWVVGSFDDLMRELDGHDDVAGILEFEWNEIFQAPVSWPISERVAMTWLVKNNGETVLPDFVERWADGVAWGR